MQIAVTGAGFTPDEADELRRSLATFRHVGTISNFRDRFLRGMLANDYPEEFAERCFSQIEGFGTYGFPESHAISFANLVYVSAWIKYHHPDVFCAALLNSQPMGFYAPAQLVRDARDHGVEVRPIDVNFSDWDCTLEKTETPGHSAVRLGLRMVAGLSENDGKTIVKARGSDYQSPGEIAMRADCGRLALNRLAQADAFGSMKLQRRQALWEVSALDGKMPPLFRGAQKHLFDEPETCLPMASPSQDVVQDYRATGLTLRSHPMKFLRSQLRAKRVTTALEVKQAANNKMVTVAGLVLFRQQPLTAKETIFLTIEDETGAVNLIVWKDVHVQYRRAVYTGKLLACRGVVQREGQVLHVVARNIWDWSDRLQNLQEEKGAAALPVRSRDFR